ncbi:hypothetical protein [Dinghuibacter silviterrae]|uniref:Uncharacterized protein n=1 Tax=Dinghuibacter silviterrae TaxID=1539049 RepID=A0A4R8DTV1_9BACT|nr:hypothetical protein [Dinghuibacter silviterrae]TDX01754.1 hypothetical protein EDB95_2796 [Dinghuibacter silviterrae]
MGKALLFIFLCGAAFCSRAQTLVSRKLMVVPLTACWPPLPDTFAPASLTKAEALHVRQLLKNTRHISKYYIQLAAATNRRNEKIVFVMGACERPEGWPAKPMGVVMDGGNCYFEAQVNLTQDKVTAFGFHGWGMKIWRSLKRPPFCFLNYSINIAAAVKWRPWGDGPPAKIRKPFIIKELWQRTC